MSTEKAIALADINKLTQYIPQSSTWKDDMRPYLVSLAKQNPELEAFDFINFIQQCALIGADPRKKDAYLIPFRTNKKFRDNASGRWVDNWLTVANVVFNYQFFIQKAKSANDYGGYEVVTNQIKYLNPYSGQVFDTIESVATAWRTGIEKPFVYRARLPEFQQVNDTGMPKGGWSKPYMMLEKCAVANVHRLAWAETLSGAYIYEEMQGQESPTHVDVIDVSGPAPAQITPPSAQVFEASAPAPTEAPPPEAPKPAARTKRAAPAPKETAPTTQGEVSAPNAPIDTQTPPPTAQAAPRMQVVQPDTTPDPDLEKIITRETKSRLWSGVQHGAKNKLIDANVALKRLSSVRLTEGLGHQLIEQMVSGNYAWFKEQATQ